MLTADERLRQFLKEGQAWEKKVTNIPGVFLLKLPTFKGTSPSTSTLRISNNLSFILRLDSLLYSCANSLFDTVKQI